MEWEDPIRCHINRNNILQKAIRLYMAERYGLDSLELETNLVPARKIKMETKKDVYGERSTFSGSYNQLRAFEVQWMPKKGMWLLVDKERQIWFMQTTNEQQVGQNPDTAAIQVKTVFSIKSYGSNASNNVNDWIDEAFTFFKEQKKSEQDTSRFFYVALSPEAGDKSQAGAAKILFKQYLLSDGKTFNSLFFPEKEALLRLIDQFQRKEGKFAIRGFPDKLGLLLDGPPGTGKTSLIKALAHYTNRHVVSVNLAKIKTNQELMDLLFDLVFPVQGGDLPVKMKFEDIIFVMEDVDAASKVVYARGKKGTKRKAKNKSKAAGVQVAAKGGSKDPPPTPSKAAPPAMPTLLRMISGNDKGESEEPQKGDGKEAEEGGEENGEEGEGEDGDEEGEEDGEAAAEKVKGE
ncbi:unnamed protein product, partial [Prorocentrum cordatum]